MYPTLFWLHFSIANNTFHDVAEIVLPAEVENTILNIDKKHFRSKISLFELGTAQTKPTFVLIFGPIALLFVPFLSYPLHAPQAGPQQTAQICVLLLKVPSLNDFTDVSDMISMTS